jgi:hypothetical protein
MYILQLYAKFDDNAGDETCPGNSDFVKNLYISIFNDDSVPHWLLLNITKGSQVLKNYSEN